MNLQNYSSSNESFNPNEVDLFLAIGSTFGLPLLASFLLAETGAFLPLSIYYGVFCFGIVKWRKKTLDYHMPDSSSLPLFLLVLLVQIGRIISSSLMYSPLEVSTFFGFLLTLILWSPINAISEQLFWIYVYDAFAQYYDTGWKNQIFNGIGLILYLTLVGLIHILFWSKFLFEPNKIFPWYPLFFLFNFVISFSYLLLYRKSDSMVPVAVIHLLTDVSAVYFTRYSIIPYL